MTTIIRGARVFDGTGVAPISDAVIAVDENKIAYVGPAVGFTIPEEDANVIDAANRTVLPGLIDLHVHMIISYKRPLDHHLERAIGATLLQGVANGERALQSGITTVRDCGAGHLGIFALRDSINAGEIRGPRIFSAGRAISMTGGSSWEALCRQADGPEECRKAAREQLRPSSAGGIFASADGADHVKVMATNGGYYREQTQLTVEEMAAIVEETHKRDRRVAAHCGGAAGAINCVKAGVDSIEHGNCLDDESIEAMMKAGTFFVPTLGVYWEPAVRGTAGGFTEHEVGYCKLFYGPHKRSFELALQAGIKIGAGTDSGSVSHILGSSLHLELQLMVDYGMTPAAALHTATGAAAEILGQEAQLGTLEVGKLADILIVDGDPLVDIGATRAIWLVLKDGQIVVDKRMQ